MKGKRGEEFSSITRFAAFGWVVMTGFYFAVANAVRLAWGIRQYSVPASAAEDFPFSWFIHLFRWDARWYHDIAVNGYSVHPDAQSNVAFFPLYPLMMRAVGAVIGSDIWGGVIITTIGAIVALTLLVKWCERHSMLPTAARLTVVLVLVYPYSWYLYGQVYSDASFLALALGACLLVHHRRFGWAAILGALATADRSTGMAVAVLLVVLAAQQEGVLRPPNPDTRLGRFGVPAGIDWRNVRSPVVVVAASASGAVAYMAYLWARFGDPVAFLTTQRYWGQGSGWDSILKRYFFEIIAEGSWSTYVWTNLAQFALAMAALVSAPFVSRRFGFAYGVFVLALLAFPLYGARDFLGTGRYLIVLFPVFALVGEWLARATLRSRVIALATSVLLITIGMAAFSKGMYLA